MYHWPTWPVLRLYSRGKHVHTRMFVYCRVSTEGQTAREKWGSFAESSFPFALVFQWALVEPETEMWDMANVTATGGLFFQSVHGALYQRSWVHIDSHPCLFMTTGVFERYCLEINAEVWQSCQIPDLHLLNRISNGGMCGCWMKWTWNIIRKEKEIKTCFLPVAHSESRDKKPRDKRGSNLGCMLTAVNEQEQKNDSWSTELEGLGRSDQMTKRSLGRRQISHSPAILSSKQPKWTLESW